MKIKLFLILLIGVFILPTVFAAPDLIVRDVEVIGEPIAMTPLAYRIHIQNIGDEPVTSRLAVRVWTNTDALEVRGSWFNLVGLTDSVAVERDGGIVFLTPEDGEVFLPGEDVPIITKTITLNPGDTAIFDSETPVANYHISFYLSERSLEGIPGYIEAEIDPHNEVAEADEDNVFHKDVVVKGGILEGPYDGSRDVPSLVENEYYVFGQGCVNINERRICAGDETVDGVERVVINVDDEERVINRYNPLYRWIVRLLAGGRESPTVDVNGVSISLYVKGFKISL